MCEPPYRDDILTHTIVIAAVAFDSLFPSIVNEAALPVLVRIVRW